MKSKKKRPAIGIKGLLAIVFVAYFCYALISQQRMLADYRKQRAELQAQITQCKNEQLRYEEMQALYEAPSFIEKMARERLGFVYPDEKVFVSTP